MSNWEAFWESETSQPEQTPLELIFEEEPVSLDTFIGDAAYMGSDWSLSPIQKDLVQHIERIYLPELYPLMAKDFGGYWAETRDVPMKNLISAQWGKGCVSGDTEVYNPKTGVWQAIETIQGNWNVQGTDEVNADGDTMHYHGDPVLRDGTAPLTSGTGKPFKRGFGRMLTVTTTTGASITVYEGHLFASKDSLVAYPEWTAAGAVRPGHLVAIATKTVIEKTTPMPSLDTALHDLSKWGVVYSNWTSAPEDELLKAVAAARKRSFKLEYARRVQRLHHRLGFMTVLDLQDDGTYKVRRLANNSNKDGVYWDMVAAVEEAGEDYYWDLTAPGTGSYLAGSVGFLNSNSGKDHSVRVASLRVAYLLLCLKSPQKYFSMPEQDSIHMLNIAMNAQQANVAFFEPMKRAVRKGWFADRAQSKQGLIEFDKNIMAISGHSDAEAQEGLNIILGVADEIDGFKSKAEMMGQANRAREASTSAESILNMMKSSASTRFPENYKRVAISYPRYIGSPIQRLTDEAKQDNEQYPGDSIYFASGPHATWEVNPRISGKEQYRSDYRKDPVEAAAKYECKPFRATSPYFRDPTIFDRSTDSEEQPIKVSYYLKEAISDRTGLRYKSWEPVYEFADWFKPINGANYAIHADLAVKGDRAGIAMSHVEKWIDFRVPHTDEDGNDTYKDEARPFVRNDFTFAYEADITTAPPREIQIRWARELAFALIARGFNITLFTFDSYQSTDSIQILESHGIETDRASTDRDPSMWRNLKDLASEGRLRMPHNQLLREELEGLNDLGAKVDHPPNGSKDLAVALCGSVKGAIVSGGEEDPDGSIVLFAEPIFNSGSAADMPIGMGSTRLSMPMGLSDGVL